MLEWCQYDTKCNTNIGIKAFSKINPEVVVCTVHSCLKVWGERFVGGFEQK